MSYYIKFCNPSPDKSKLGKSSWKENINYQQFMYSPFLLGKNTAHTKKKTKKDNFFFFSTAYSLLSSYTINCVQKSGKEMQREISSKHIFSLWYDDVTWPSAASLKPGFSSSHMSSRSPRRAFLHRAPHKLLLWRVALQACVLTSLGELVWVTAAFLHWTPDKSLCLQSMPPQCSAK